MGIKNQKMGDGHILFHVGKEVPNEGENLMLVPGVQKAQGRGVYFSDEPRLKYSGGEHFQKELEVTPIFCVPMVGEWTKIINKKKEGEISYNTHERTIALFGLKSFESEIDGMRVKYFYPAEVSFFKEPDVERSGRHITSQFSEGVLAGQIDFESAINALRDQHESIEEHVGEEYILKQIEIAVADGRMPENEKILEQRRELDAQKNGEERMGLKMR